jgi:hypothetical protein
VVLFFVHYNLKAKPDNDLGNTILFAKLVHKNNAAGTACLSRETIYILYFLIFYQIFAIVFNAMQVCHGTLWHATVKAINRFKADLFTHLYLKKLLAL